MLEVSNVKARPMAQAALNADPAAMSCGREVYPFLEHFIEDEPLVVIGDDVPVFPAGRYIDWAHGESRLVLSHMTKAMT